MKHHVERVAMARTSKIDDEVMLIDSGTTAHKISRYKNVFSQTFYSVDRHISRRRLKFESNQSCERKVKWQSQNGTRTVSLLNTLVCRDLSIFIHSAPGLDNKGIEVLFKAGNAKFGDLNNIIPVSSTEIQEKDGLFYISDMQTSAPNNHVKRRSELKPIMGIANKHIRNEKEVAPPLLKHDMGCTPRCSVTQQTPA